MDDPRTASPHVTTASATGIQSGSCHIGGFARMEIHWRCSGHNRLTIALSGESADERGTARHRERIGECTLTSVGEVGVINVPASYTAGEATVAKFWVNSIGAQGTKCVLKAQVQTGPNSVFSGPLAEWMGDPLHPSALPCHGIEPPPPGPFPPAPPGPPPPEPCASPAIAGAKITNHLAEDEFFRFLWMHGSPERACEASLLLISCPEFPTGLDFPQALTNAKRSPDKLREAAKAFITGPDFIGSCDAVNKIVPHPHHLDWTEPHSLEAFHQMMADATTMPPADLVKLSDFQSLYLRLWESLMAVAILPPDDVELANNLVILIRLFNVITLLAPPHQIPTDEIGWRYLSHAVPVLPIYAVPMAAVSDTDWLRPLGMGDVNVVSRTFHGYALGEVASVRSVMKGELKVQMERKSSATGEARTVASEHAHTDYAATDNSGEAELRQAVRNVVTKSSLENDYDNLTITPGTSVCCATPYTIAGKWTATGDDSETGQDDDVQYAQRVMSRVIRQIDEKIAVSRSSFLVRQQENQTTSEIDNRQGLHNVNGVYRWLQKKFRLTMHRAKRQLVLEALIANPAQSFIDKIKDKGTPITPPPALNIKVTGIKPENYLALAQAQDIPVASLPLPPAQTTWTLVLSSTQSNLPLGKVSPGTDCVSGRLDIPASVVQANVTAICVSGDPAVSIVGVVGNKLLQFAAPVLAENAPSSETAATAASGQCTLPNVSVGADGIPISVICAPQSVISFTATSAAPVPDVALAIWQQEIYDRLERGHRQALQAYDEAYARRIAAAITAIGSRTIEVRELKTRVLAIAGQGTQSPPTYRFFDQAIEFDRMTYAFYPTQTGAEPSGPTPLWYGQSTVPLPGDALFAEFLTAASARVLVPVKPGYELSVLFALAYGQLWPAAGGNVPVTETDRVVVLELHPSRPHPECPASSWMAEVPTAHAVLVEREEWPWWGAHPQECL